MTVGDRIAKLTSEYIKLYERFKVDGDSPFGDDPAGMATHDLRMKIFTYQEALREVQAHIDADGGNDD